MTTDRDLLLAILALDAYNRGYNPGIDGLSDARGTKIGSATIDTTSNIVLPGSESVAFYAVAYDDPSYGKIISYRGTDNGILAYSAQPAQVATAARRASDRTSAYQRGRKSAGAKECAGEKTAQPQLDDVDRATPATNRANSALELSLITPSPPAGSGGKAARRQCAGEKTAQPQLDDVDRATPATNQTKETPRRTRAALQCEKNLVRVWSSG